MGIHDIIATRLYCYMLALLLLSYNTILAQYFNMVCNIPTAPTILAVATAQELLLVSNPILSQLFLQQQQSNFIAQPPFAQVPFTHPFYQMPVPPVPLAPMSAPPSPAICIGLPSLQIL